MEWLILLFAIWGASQEARRHEEWGRWSRGIGNAQETGLAPQQARKEGE